MDKTSLRVLVGSPVRQKPAILERFLAGIRELSLGPGITADYCFVDDNHDPESSRLLQEFVRVNPGTGLIRAGDDSTYICDEKTHVWEEGLIWKVAFFKNCIIDKARMDNHDYLFLIDSDLVLHPKTLEHLVSLKKDIISEIFWTKWDIDYPELPQVWASDQYTLYESSRAESLTPTEVLQRVQAFLARLRTPGVYPVGGLGACTLISRKALQGGVSFSEIPNLSFVGEDRHFCIRAAALGFELFVDTHYPAFHIYRSSDLENLPEFKKQNKA